VRDWRQALKCENIQIKLPDMWLNINVDHLKETLLSCNEIEAAYLFGSAARREPVVNDLDLLILADSNKNTHHLYFNLLHRITNDQKIPESQIDILFFDICLADPYILDRAVNTGILLCNRNEKLLTDRIEELSLFFLENEFLLNESIRLKREKREVFCGIR
jgi:predicted nucleotidyltransferase